MIAWTEKNLILKNNFVELHDRYNGISWFARMDLELNKYAMVEIGYRWGNLLFYTLRVGSDAYLYIEISETDGLHIDQNSNAYKRFMVTNHISITNSFLVKNESTLYTYIKSKKFMIINGINVEIDII